MKRRKVIQQIGVGLAAGIFMPTYFSSCKKDDPGPEIPFDGTIAVIGAGAAGLYAADILRSKGLNVIVFEAASQLGGRIRSLRNQREINPQSIADFPVELGADIVYGSDSSWSKIIKNFNLPTFDLVNGIDRFILDKTPKIAAAWQSDSDFVAAQNYVKSIGSFAGGAVSVRQAANGVSARAQELINAQVGNRYGTSSERLGAKPLAEEIKLLTRDSKSFTVTTNPLQDLLLSRFNEVAKEVNLNTPIATINYGGDKIVLTDKSGQQYEVARVVVTVPISVIKTGGISFSPALPSAFTSSTSRIGMDACIRVVLDFKKNFWGENSGFIWGGSGVPSFFNAGIGRSDFHQTMVITICGQKAEQLALGSDIEIVNAVLAEIDQLYNRQGTDFIRRDLTNNNMIYFVKNWAKDEFIKGGFSYPTVNATAQDRKNLCEPISNKLFFAGEATDLLGDGGTVNGALNSAERVAESVIKSITG